MIRNIRGLVLLVLVGLVSTGCARFQSHQVSGVADDFPPVERKETKLMTYSIDKTATYGALGIYEQSLTSAMRRYGWRLRQSEIPKDNIPHMYVNVDLVKDPAAVLPAIITGLTLYTIPSWETSSYKVTAQILDSKDKEYFYEVKDKIVLVQWLPMILAFPFAYPFSAEEETITRMYENIALKVNEDYGSR